MDGCWEPARRSRAASGDDPAARRGTVVARDTSPESTRACARTTNSEELRLSGMEGSHRRVGSFDVTGSQTACRP